ncbi:lipopolysaccharide biosynthesis protein [Cellulosimicrobium cellulans]|uniref:lipopolysaccharide biosynthesis protein n=1 Tax=Cellulosimicrobium cellulans TaxID=1710 RepID=UPI0036DFD940
MLSTTGIVVNGGARFVYNLLIGNLRGPAFLGPVSAAVSSALFASILLPQAIANAATRFVADATYRTAASAAVEVSEASEASDARHRADPDAVAWLLARWLLVTGTLLGVAVALGVELLSDRGLLFAASAGVLTVAYSAYVFARAVQFARFKARRAAGSDVLAGVVAILTLLSVLAVGADTFVLAPLAVGYALAAVVNWPRRPRERVVPLALRHEIRHFVAFGSIASIATGGMLQASMIVAQWAGSDLDSGLYAAAFSIATPLSMISTAIAMIVVPRMAAARASADSRAFPDLVDSAFRGVASISMLAFGVVTIGAVPILGLLYDAEFRPAAVPLAVLALAMLALTAQMPVSNALVVSGQRGVRYAAVVAAAGAVVGAILWAVLAPWLGNVGVALGVLAATASPLVALTTRTSSELGLRWRLVTLRFVVLAVSLVGCAALAVTDARTWVALATFGGYAVLWCVLSGLPDRRAVVATLFSR